MPNKTWAGLDQASFVDIWLKEDGKDVAHAMLNRSTEGLHYETYLILA